MWRIWNLFLSKFRLCETCQTRQILRYLFHIHRSQQCALETKTLTALALFAVCVKEPFLNLWSYNNKLCLLKIAITWFFNFQNRIKIARLDPFTHTIHTTAGFTSTLNRNDRAYRVGEVTANLGEMAWPLDQISYACAYVNAYFRHCCEPASILAFITHCSKSDLISNSGSKGRRPACSLNFVLTCQLPSWTFVVPLSLTEVLLLDHDQTSL